MRNLIAAAPLVLIVATPAHAELWYRVWENPQAIAYLDRDTLDREDITVVTVKTVYSQTYKDSVVGGLSRVEIDCLKNTYRNLSYQSLDAEGQVVKSWTYAQHEPYPLSPKMMYMSVRNFACSRSGGTPVEDPIADAAERFAPKETGSPG